MEISKTQVFCLNKNKNKNKIIKFLRKINSKNIILDRDGVINKDLAISQVLKKLDWINGFQKQLNFLMTIILIFLLHLINQE